MLVTEYKVGAGAYGVAVAADGAVWTSLTGRGELTRVGPDGQVSQIRLDTAQSRPMVLARGPDPHAVAATPDGGCWATLWAASSVIRLDRDGGLAGEISFQPGSEPHGIALGPDGSVWVALEAGSLAHLTP
jgi:virginiamycin B lyase